MNKSKKQISPPAALPSNSLTYTTPDRLVLDFASRGLVVLAPESLGIPAAVHDEVYAQEKKVHGKGVRVTPANVPAVLDLLKAPGLIDVCNQLVGKNWAIVPFTHNASFTSGARDQHWHKDDNGPYNSRKVRHHQAVQIEMLYYPQVVTEQMGPTATVPYSQYWTFNHEENHDNFAGADHLDFGYALSGMERESISGPDSKYARADIINARTAHDIRMREAVTKTGWPLVYEMLFQSLSMRLQRAGLSAIAQLFQLFDATVLILVEIGAQGIFADGGQRCDQIMWQSVALEPECFHLTLHDRVRMMVSLVLKRGLIRWAEIEFEHAGDHSAILYSL